MPHPESKMRASVLGALRKNGFHAEAVDNESCSPGTPDVTYCGLDLSSEVLEGWIELKQIPGWPSCAATVVAVRHLTLKQCTWLRKRWAFGGTTSILLRVGNGHAAHWLLIPGNQAIHVGNVDSASLRGMAVEYLQGQLSAVWLHNALCALHAYRNASEPRDSI